MQVVVGVALRAVFGAHLAKPRRARGSGRKSESATFHVSRRRLLDADFLLLTLQIHQGARKLKGHR
jgi:hypothetical protein